MSNFVEEGEWLMRVPIKIEEAIKVAGESFQVARESEKIVREWLDSKGYCENDAVAYQFIDYIENGSNSPNTFIKLTEQYEQITY